MKILLFIFIFFQHSSFAADKALSSAQFISNKNFKEPTRRTDFSKLERDTSENYSIKKIKLRSYFTCNVRVELLRVNKGKLVGEDITMAAGLSYKTSQYGFNGMYHIFQSWDKVTYQFLTKPKIAEFDDLLYDKKDSNCQTRKTEYLRFYYVLYKELSYWDKLFTIDHTEYFVKDPFVMDVWELINELEVLKKDGVIGPAIYRALKDHESDAIFYIKISLP